MAVFRSSGRVGIIQSQFPSAKTLMRNPARIFASVAVIALLPTLVVAQIAAVPKQAINTGRPNPNLSGGIKVGDMLFASGQLGSPDSTIEVQTRQALEKTKAVLEAGGTSMENVVKCTVFLVKQSDFQAMNGVYRTFFPKDPPARSTVVVAALVSNSALVEIECMAAIPK
jgi:2-iminobutanoate/2-iminopropanoate deaminase